MKKAQSQIVTAVLLILIVIALAVVVLNFSMNFVKDKLSGTGCFEAVDKVTFTNSKDYTCIDTKGTDAKDDDVLNLQVHIGDINERISGFLIETGGASTISREIKNNTQIGDVKMYNSAVDDLKLDIPGRNEERTYVFDIESPETVKIYPILTDGQVCEASDILEKIILCKD